MKTSLSRENIWLFITGFMLCSFAFSERINSWGLGLLVLFFLADKNLFAKLKNEIPLKRIWPVAGFYFLYLIFYLFSAKDGDAFHTMFIKISLFILPFLFAYESYFTKANEQKLLLAFSIALSLGFLYSLLYSYFHFYHNLSNASAFSFLNRMSISSGIMHPGYYSNFFMLAIIWQYFSANRMGIYFMVAFTIILFLLLSRIVLLFYLLFVLFVLVKAILKSKKPLLTTLVVLTLMGLISAGLYQISTIKIRVNDTINGLKVQDTAVDYSSATASRSIAYQEELKMVKAKPIFGYGLGNATEALQEQLDNAGFHALAKDMHTHNQYFNTWFHTGIIGFVWLCGLLLFLAYYFYKKNNKVGLWFTILVAMNLLTDDMLEIQAGIVFFALIWSLNLFNQPEKITS